MVYETRYSDSLTRYGIKGQKWGRQTVSESGWYADR